MMRYRVKGSPVTLRCHTCGQEDQFSRIGRDGERYGWGYREFDRNGRPLKSHQLLCPRCMSRWAHVERRIRYQRAARPA